MNIGKICWIKEDMCYVHDLSKAFDTIYHNLLTAKIGAHGFSQDALQYMRGYLTNKQQRVRVNSNFITWENIVARFSQGSILGPLLLNIFINLFRFVSFCFIFKQLRRICLWL